jgi:DNA-binding NarL/FixJ family response regulator
METLRVLIVDDVAQVRRDLAMVLTLTGQVGKDRSLEQKRRIEVVGEAANGLEAVRMAEALQPQVVLMDLEMPVMGGCEAARRIKERCPGCRVIALTVHDDQSTRLEAMQVGMEAFVVKGAPLESLLRAIWAETAAQ